MEKRGFLFAVCGEKHTGKTTLTEKLIAALTERGLRVASIKHDGHEFSADVPTTDSYRHLAAGAYATAVYDEGKFMVVKRRQVTEQQLAALFPEADIILLEGGKGSVYPKVQMVTAEKTRCICNEENLIAFVSDGTAAPLADVPCYDRNDAAAIAEAILKERFLRRELSMVVLAGGLSRRMGRDKAELTVGDTTFLEHQIEKGRALGIRDILVSGYRGSGCTVPVIADEEAQRGPLGGLCATLPHAENEKVLVVPVDVPAVSVQTLRRLALRSIGSTRPVTVLRHGEKIEPLLGVYEKHTAEAMRQALAGGNGAVMALLEQVGFEEFVWEDDPATLENINTAAQYAAMGGEARCIR